MRGVDRDRAQRGRGGRTQVAEEQEVGEQAPELELVDDERGVEVDGERGDELRGRNERTKGATREFVAGVSDGG